MTVVAFDAQLRAVEAVIHSITLPTVGIRKSGGADRDRTGDLMLAKHALSQLSYSPVEMVGLGRVELPTSPLSGVRSSQLSYRPGYHQRLVPNHL
jgi:hypothetical protein